MTFEELKDRILDIATDNAHQGPGKGQERAVLRAVEHELGPELSRLVPQKLKREQLLLTAWHELFREGKLVWGYNTDNPGSPFFHVPVRTLEEVG
jgi:hypothetical protein